MRLIMIKLDCVSEEVDHYCVDVIKNHIMHYQVFMKVKSATIKVITPFPEELILIPDLHEESVFFIV